MKTCKPESPSNSWRSSALITFFLLVVSASGADVVFQSLRPFGQLGSLAPLFQASDGNLYGTTGADGTNGAGTVFRLTTAGQLTILHSFTGGSDRGNPIGGVIQATDGNLYGTTSEELGGG